MYQIKIHKKKGTSVVDADIRGLVAAMNVHGFRTYASCQGHGFPVDRIKPYVAFTANQSVVICLARCLRNDAESCSPELKWGWEITAGFDSAYRLCFRLHPAGPHHWSSRYCRRSLRQDLVSLCRFLKSPGRPQLNGINPSWIPQPTEEKRLPFHASFHK